MNVSEKFSYSAIILIPIGSVLFNYEYYGLGLCLVAWGIIAGVGWLLNA